MSAEARKAEIVECALKLVDVVGPDHLTTDMIAREIGLTQPAIFRHFPKKEAIWTAVAGRLQTDMAAAWEAAAASGSPEDALERLTMAQVGVIEATPAIAHILFSRELHIHNAELRAAVMGNQRRFHGLLSQAVAGAVANGRFRAELDPSDAAMLVIGVVQSLALRWSLSEKSFDLKADAARLLSLLVAGFTQERRHHA